MKAQFPHSNPGRPMLAGRCWLWILLLFCLPALFRPQPTVAQTTPCLATSPEAITKQLQRQGYAFGCLPEAWNLFSLGEDAWVREVDIQSLGHRIQQEIFILQLKSGHFDDFVVGGQPAWQTGEALQWQIDFAAIGYRTPASGDQTREGPVFALAAWLGSSVDLDGLAQALQERAHTYETIELETFHLRYLDGNEPLPPQTAYVLDGAQMQELFRLDSNFINNRYVIIKPSEMSQSFPGLPVFSFFSGTPITAADMAPLLQNLLFRPRLLPQSPDPDQVADIRTPLGLLAQVPSIRSEAQALIDRKAREIRDWAMEFAREMPFSHLLPYALHTVDTNLYWAPWDMQTGRLILWEYTGGAHGNPTVTSWTFTAGGEAVALAEILDVALDEALDLVIVAAVEHRRAHDSPGTSDESIREWVESGLADLESLSAWNPVIQNGQMGLLITLDPYVIAPYTAGIQEFFVEIPLKAPR